MESGFKVDRDKMAVGFLADPEKRARVKKRRNIQFSAVFPAMRWGCDGAFPDPCEKKRDNKKSKIESA